MTPIPVDMIYTDWLRRVKCWQVVSKLLEMLDNPNTPADQILTVKEAINLQVVEEVGILSHIEA